MSIALMTAAWALDLPSTEKLVLLALADNANDSGCCWPSMATIARKCGLTDRAVRAAMRRLEEGGHVSSSERAGTSRLYTVSPGTSFRPEGGSARKEVPPTPERRSPKPSRTTNSSTKTTSSPKKRARTAEAFELPDWVPAQAWDAWLDMRRSKGGRDTAYALNLAVKQLQALADAGHPPGAVLDQSTLSRWTKLYPIKDNQDGLSQRTNRLGRDHGAGAGRDRPVDGFTAALRRASAGLAADDDGGGGRAPGLGIIDQPRPGGARYP